MIKPISKLDSLFKENEELIAVISKSINTAKKNKENGSKDKKPL